MAVKTKEERIARRLKRRYRGTYWYRDVPLKELARIVWLHGEWWAKAAVFRSHWWTSRYPEDPGLARVRKQNDKRRKVRDGRFYVTEKI